ncbi:MAG: cytochrome c/FTR1 family iron permease [Myxococcota bacterium]|nr:cytochrome c/FTR1 family iron permease [Myxococcota bacterium]
MLKTTFNIRRWAAFLAVALAMLALVVLAFRGGRASPLEQSRASSVGGSDAQHLVAILQYLESDYPAAIASQDRGELAEQASLSAEALAVAKRLPRLGPFVARVASVDEQVRRAGEGAQGTEGAKEVAAACASLVDDLVTATGISRAPGAPPDLAEGSRLFAQNCAACHGLGGHGDGPAAAALSPKPANFHSDAVMARLTPFKAFNVVRFGVKGTAMVPFDGLDDRKRWALAFYVFSLRQPECDHAPPRVPLEALANSSDEDLAKSAGAGEVACLRRRVPELDAPALLGAARSRVQEAVRLAGQGDPSSAEKAILDAYLSDVEPIEPWLRARDAEVVTQLEASFTTTRAAFQQRDAHALADAGELVALLDRAAGAQRTTTRLSVFWFSLLVIVREGFEATVIIAALLAVLKKRNEASRARHVHLGWVCALAAGALVFAVGRRVLAGAMNEKLEGCLALVAVAMLLHAAFWINARGTTRRNMGELRDRTRGALARGALALFGISFLAMFRESFETAIFLEALSIDAPSAVVWGAIAGALLLLGFVLAIGRLGLRLPMRTLFEISTGVLLATAVVLLGQGIHSLEEVGLLPSRPMPFVRIPFLGLFPDRVGLLAQLVLASVPVVWRLLIRRSVAKKGALTRAAEPGE